MPTSRQPSRGRPSRSQPAGSRSRPGGPAGGAPLLTPGASAFRQAVERRSATWLVYLSRLPRWVPAVVLGAVFLAGLFAPGVAGAVALLVIAAALGLLAVVTWPSVPSPARVVRLVVIAALVAGAAAKLLT